MSKLQELKEELEEEKDLAGKMAVCSRKKKENLFCDKNSQETLSPQVSPETNNFVYILLFFLVLQFWGDILQLQLIVQLQDKLRTVI